MNCRQIAKKACKEWFAYQDPFELEMALRSLKKFHPKRICEIGTANGASIASWCEACKPELAIGLDPLTNPKTPEQQASFDYLMQKYNIKMIPYISRFQEAHDMMKNFLKGKKLDFLFIDGEHGFRDVVYDFNFYLPYMNSPSIIGFHDIYYREDLIDSGQESGLFWERIKKKYNYDEFVYHSTMGIGFIYLK